MPLPKISTPTYELTVPSTWKNIKFRPFLVKEEKILIIAMESQSDKQIAQAVNDVLSNCILTKGVKIDDLSTFDIEYLFLNIRGKSVGETVDVMITCPDDNQTKVPVQINLDDIQIVKNDNHQRDISLDDNLTMRMKYPAMGEFIKNNFSVDMKVDDTFDLVCSCIEQVFSEEESWAASDCTKKELHEFLEQLDTSQFKKIEQFFATMPKLKYEGEVINPNTQVATKVEIEGLANFFG